MFIRHCKRAHAYPCILTALMAAFVCILLINDIYWMEIRGDRSRKFGGRVGVKGSLVGCHLKVQHFYTVDLTFLNGRSKLQRKGFFCLLHRIQHFYTVDQ